MSSNERLGLTKGSANGWMGVLALITILPLVLWGCATRPHSSDQHSETYAPWPHTHPEIGGAAPDALGTLLLDCIESKGTLIAMWKPNEQDKLWCSLKNARQCLTQIGEDEGESPQNCDQSTMSSGLNEVQTHSTLRWFLAELESLALEAYVTDPNNWGESCLQAACTQLTGWYDNFDLVVEESGEDDCPWPSSNGKCKPDY